MTATAMRNLADSLERNFMTEEDRKGWIQDLRGHARGVEWSLMADAEEEEKGIDRD